MFNIRLRAASQRSGVIDSHNGEAHHTRSFEEMFVVWKHFTTDNFVNDRQSGDPHATVLTLPHKSRWRISFDLETSDDIGRILAAFSATQHLLAPGKFPARVAFVLEETLITRTIDRYSIHRVWRHIVTTCGKVVARVDLARNQRAGTHNNQREQNEVHGSRREILFLFFGRAS